LDRYVIEMVITASSSTGFVERLKARLVLDRDTSAVTAQRDRDWQALAELTRDRYVRRIIREPEYLIARRELDARLADGDELLARRPQTCFLIDLPTIEKELREAWVGRWTLNEQRRILRMVFRHLVGKPANEAYHGSIRAAFRQSGESSATSTPASSLLVRGMAPTVG
jgi:hypothetical protein